MTERRSCGCVFPAEEAPIPCPEHADGEPIAAILVAEDLSVREVMVRPGQRMVKIPVRCGYGFGVLIYEWDGQQRLSDGRPVFL